MGLSIGGAVALQVLHDEPHILDHLMMSGTSTRLPPYLGTLKRLDEQDLRLFNHDRLAEYLLQPYRIPRTYRNLLLADLRKVEPVAMRHFVQEMTKIQLPREEQVPMLIAVGQQEAFDIKHAAYEMRRAIHCARGVLVPGVGHFWNLEAPDLFTMTLRAWIQNESLPPNLAQLGVTPS